MASIFLQKHKNSIPFFVVFCYHTAHSRIINKGKKSMKRIFVFSDSHKNMENMRIVLWKEKPDLVIHLGDEWEDSKELRAEFRDIPMECVPGNCDTVREPLEKILQIEGKRILLCHGHTYNVKMGYMRIRLAAISKGVDAVLFGHTHFPLCEKDDEILMLNPGCVGYSTPQSKASYGWITIDGDVINAGIEYIAK